jgi:hypothetical protein
MVTRRSFLGGALATPVVAAGAAGVVLHGDSQALAASPYAPSEDRMQQPPFLFGLHAPRDALASRLRERERQLGRAADVVLVFARIT